MNRLADRVWKPKYSREDGDIVRLFYVPALSCAVRYDRTTGYFSATALAIAARGVEGLVRNGGRMRLVVGCTLEEDEVRAIERGTALQEAVGERLGAMPLVPEDAGEEEALEFLAWMVAHSKLEVKVAVPCDAARRPIAGTAVFHEKVGIIEDAVGDRLGFSGGINETRQGWTQNWDSFHVYASWTGLEGHVDADEETFSKLWSNVAEGALVVDVPTAVREELLRFLPPDGVEPSRMRRFLPADEPDPTCEAAVEGAPIGPSPPAPIEDPRRLVWSFIVNAPKLPNGGERIGEATSAVTPWPHQVRAFHRMYDDWPPKLLLADEVGLGKTIQAGMLLRQAWLAGRARRILVLAPKAVLRQWQLELREKFNLNWPIYDGQRLRWARTPVHGGVREEAVARNAWHRQDQVLVSSYLVRRQERARELLEDGEPWDVIVVDEAHHARRRGGGLGVDDRPNQLLRLLQQLRQRTQGLVLLTATPMQISPIEVVDLLDLLGLPPAWHAQAFLSFFEDANHPNPSHEALARMARLFRAVEATYGEVSEEEARQLLGGTTALRARRVLRALRDEASIPLRQLSADERRGAVRLMKANTPIRRLISRHTRELLRRYHAAGKIGALIASREVEDRFVEMTSAEREVYDRVERYVSTTYNNAAPDARTAVGFIMTVYRRRLASSFQALARTLENRLAALTQGAPLFRSPQDPEEDAADDEARDDVMDADEAARLEHEALGLEERGDIEALLREVRRLPTDTKAAQLIEVLRELQTDGYHQAMVFTQYTDTMEFLRDQLVRGLGWSVMCFSGRGGEVLDPAGSWRLISRDDAKRMFADGRAELLICTDAAAEGLNFQFCGALVNYDMPWNPMRVEQRIGRIDRLGQAYERIRIVNLHYSDTVESDVYAALRGRIRLFQTFVGRLQPILARLPRAIAETTLSSGDPEQVRHRLVADVERQAAEAERSGFDLDKVTESELEDPPRPEPLYDLDDLRRVLLNPSLMPPGAEVEPIGGKDWKLSLPGIREAIRVTTDPLFFETHAESTELWSPGSPLFTPPNDLVGVGAVSGAAFRAALGPAAGDEAGSRRET